VLTLPTRNLSLMALLQCVSSSPPVQDPYRARSEEKEGKQAPAVKTRRQSLPSAAAASRLVRRSSVTTSPSTSSGWSKHYEKKKSTESLDQLTSRTLSPPPETLPRKYSRSASVLSSHSSSGRLPRHPELPPLTSQVAAPSLKDYLDKPRLVSTHARRPSQTSSDVDDLVPGLSKLTSYYNQTFLNVCDTCDSLNHRNPVSVLNAAAVPTSNSPHRGM